MGRVSITRLWLTAAAAASCASWGAVGQQDEDAAPQEAAQPGAVEAGAVEEGAAEQAAAAVFDRTPQKCIVVQQIDQTEAIDDQNLIFYMRGSRVYRSHLPRKCPNLERENRIGYETRGGRLCTTDLITVLEQFGTTLHRGFTCRLGEFVPLSPEEVEDIDFRKRERRSGIEAKSVDVEENGAETDEADVEAQTDEEDGP
jgi:hypothetical protein